MGDEVAIAELRGQMNALNTNFAKLEGYMQSGLQHRMDTTARLAVIEKVCKGAEDYQKECTADRVTQALQINSLKGEVKSQVKIAAVVMGLLSLAITGGAEWFRR